MKRQRQIQFKSPLECPELEHEFDPERLLWVPGKKKIFLPSPKKTFSIDWGLITPMTIENLYGSLWYDADRICVPGRSGYINFEEQ